MQSHLEMGCPSLLPRASFCVARLLSSYGSLILHANVYHYCENE